MGDELMNEFYLAESPGLRRGDSAGGEIITKETSENRKAASFEAAFFR